MLILTHIILALGALALSTLANFMPSANKLKISYGLAAGTLSTGVLLIVVSGADILRTCLTGIVFFGIVSILNETARKRLATQED